MARLVDVFPLRVGLVAADPVTSSQATFYEKLAEGFTGEVCTAARQRRPPRTLNTARIQDRPELVAQALAEVEGDVNPDATALVLDLSVHTSGNFRTDRGQYRGTVWVHLADVIDRLLTSWQKAFPDRLLIALLDELPPPGEVFREILDRYLVSGRLALADVTGALEPTLETENRIDETLVRTALQDASKSDLTLLERKIIRRLGWFRGEAEEAAPRFVRYYYDCHLAEEEITRLLEREHATAAAGSHALAYDPSGCTWLRTPVRAAAEGLEVPWIDLRTGSCSTGETPQHANAYLIVPAIETGASLRAAVQRAAELGLQIDRAVAILSTDGPESTMGSRAVEVDGCRLDVRYFVRIEQLSVAVDSEDADPTFLGVKWLTYHQAASDDCDELSPYEYWDLVRQVGWKAEEDVPAARRSLGQVPDFPRMLSMFGTWLAHRLALRVERALGESIENLLFVRPAQERGSQVLSEYLELVAGARVVPVERDVFDSYRRSHGMELATAAEIETRRDDWFLKLASRSVESVVFLDEFVAGGGTLDDVIALGERLGFTVAAAACLADFGPSLLRPVPVHALYRARRLNAN